VKQVCPDASGTDVLDWIDRGAGEPAARFWTLDPIDGTKGFLRGQQYAVALALIEEGEVVVGALGMPNLNVSMEEDIDGAGSLVVAVRGEGAWAAAAGGKDFTRLQVSSRVDPGLVRVLRSYESGHTNVSQIDVFVGQMGITHPPVRMDSQAKFAVLAGGQGELILRLLSPSRPDYHEKIWDQAAGSIVIEEAGGRVTDLAGRALDFTRGRELLNNTGVLVSNGALHAAALAALRELGADQRPVSQLPAVETMASCIPLGLFEALSQSHDLILAWLDQNIYQICGPGRGSAFPRGRLSARMIQPV